MAVAELAKTAIEKQDRMGIIAFSNLGRSRRSSNRQDHPSF